MWNETGTFRVKFSWKIRNGPRFKMRWNLFRFVSFFELVLNVSAIPGETERNWQPWLWLVKDCRKEGRDRQRHIKCLVKVLITTRWKVAWVSRVLRIGCVNVVFYRKILYSTYMVYGSYMHHTCACRSASFPLLFLVSVCTLRQHFETRASLYF
jgi:hypothetical protein